MKYLDGSFPFHVQFISPRNEINGIKNPLYTDWMDDDATIILWLNSTISDSVIAYFASVSPSFELWKRINDRFARVSSTHSIQLRTTLLSIKQGDKSR